MKRFLALLTGALMLSVALAAQAPPAAPAAKEPKVKTQKEGEALNAIFRSQDPDAQMKMVDAFIVGFADTDFKGLVLQVAAMAAQAKNDFEKMILYSERTLEVDPKNYNAMIILAAAIAQGTKEFDLDKEEKLAKSEKNAKAAIEIVKAAPKPNPQLPDDQWEIAKKDFLGQANSALGIAALARKKYDDAINYFKVAVEATNDPAARVRLASTYNQVSKWDDALAAIAPLYSDPQLHPVIKQFADGEKKRAEAGKAAKK